MRTYCSNTAAVFCIPITKIYFSNNTTQSTNNIIQVAQCQSLKTVKGIVDHISKVFNCIWTRDTILHYTETTVEKTERYWVSHINDMKISC